MNISIKGILKMKKILSIITLTAIAFITTPVMASSAYFGSNVSTDTNDCKSLTGTLGYKYFNGIGPQVRLIGTNGTLCKSEGSKLAFDLRKDFKLGIGQFIGNVNIGVETTTSLKNPEFVKGIGVGHPINKNFLIEATINSTKDNNGKDDTMYGVGINYIF